MVGLTLLILAYAQAPATELVLEHPGCGIGIADTVAEVSADIEYRSAERRATGGSTVIISARLDPIVIRQGIDTFRITLGISDPDVISVRMQNTGNGPLIQNGVTPSEIEFFDDGTNGDEVSGDSVFTAINILPPLFSGQPTGRWLVLNKTFTVTRSDLSEESFEQNTHLYLQYIDPAVVPIPTVEQLAEDVYRTDHVVHLIMEYSNSFPNFNFNQVAAGQRYYELFPDSRDMLFMTAPINDGGGNGIFFFVRNAIQGIGQSIFDPAIDYGSPSELQGVVRIKSGTVSFGLLNHEINHRWAGTLPPSTDLTPNLAFPGHWQQIMRDASGFSAGAPNGVHEFIELVEGNLYRLFSLADANGLINFVQEFSDLERYLMGLIGPEEVQEPIMTLVNPVFDHVETFLGSTTWFYFADEFRGVTMDEIIAAAGPRIPGPDISQRHFRFGMIVVHDRPLTPIEMAYYEYPAMFYTRNASLYDRLTFIEAAGGLVTATSGIPRPGDCDGDHISDQDEIDLGAADCNANGVPDLCESLRDCNLNAIQDICELVGNDCDQNGVPDDCELDVDCNGSGILDVCELEDNDCNTNNIPDECEPDEDCNVNGIQDICELVENDCNSDLIPDECQLVDNDCNDNLTPDECEIFLLCDLGCQLVNDCNANGVPDDCDVAEADCNNNGFPDDCDLLEPFQHDCCMVGPTGTCNNPSIADCVCSIERTCCTISWEQSCVDLVEGAGCGTCAPVEPSLDCNGNGVPDECDIAGGLEDCDGNGVPDLCDQAGYADVDGNGEEDLRDLLCMLDGLADVFNCDNVTPAQLDIFPCNGGDDTLDLDDAIAMLDTLNGEPPCPCP